LLVETQNLPEFGTVVLRACPGLQSGHCEPVQRKSGSQCIGSGLQ